MGNLRSKRWLPGGARKASERNSLSWLGESSVSFSGNEHRKVFPDRESLEKVILYLKNSVSA